MFFSCIIIFPRENTQFLLNFFIKYFILENNNCENIQLPLKKKSEKMIFRCLAYAWHSHSMHYKVRLNRTILTAVIKND